MFSAVSNILAELKISNCLAAVRPSQYGELDMAPDPRQLRSQRFPLHAAVETGDFVRVKGLLEGAMASQINRRYETSGQTPLHIAASEASQEMIQLLLEAGAGVGRLDISILEMIVITVR